MKLSLQRLLLALIVGLLCTIPGLAQAAITPDELTRKADEYLNAHVKMGRFSGAVLIARDGQVLFSKGYGLANIEHNLPNSPQTKFRLGSITKQFTAAAVLLLQEQGKLNVQDSVCNYLAECPPAWQPVTIHHLLTHTAGIPNFTSFPDYRKTMMLPSPPASTITRFKDKPLEFTPGERFNYSNSGYILLGHVIEKASGQSYARFLKERILQPLDLINTGYDETASILKQRAAGYARQDNSIVNAAYLDMTIPHAAGAMYSTVEDLLAWDQALYTDKLLSAKSREAMFTPFKSNYGYGWTIANQFNRPIISHGGGINGFSTMIARYPTEKILIVALSNFEDGPSGRIARDLGAILFGEKYELPKERVAIKVDPKLYDAYVGVYELLPNFILTISREGDRLLLQATGQPQLEIFPESETKFFLKAVEAQVTFVKNDQGQVTQLILHQGGERPAKKIK